MALILTTFYRLYLHWCVLNAYSLYFVLNLHTSDSDWAVTETHTKRQGILLFTFFFPILEWYFYTTITKNVSLINILINISENKVDWNICQGKTRAKYSRFRYDGKSGEMASSTRRGRQRDEWRVPTRIPSSCRPGILRSLMAYTTRKNSQQLHLNHAVSEQPKGGINLYIER